MLDIFEEAMTMLWIRRCYLPRHGLIGRIGGSVLVLVVLAGVLPALPASAQSRSEVIGLRHSTTLHANASDPPCDPAVYTKIIQSPIQQWKDCGASISLPATIHVCPWQSFSNSKLRAACIQKATFVPSFSVPGLAVCSPYSKGTPPKGDTCLSTVPQMQSIALDSSNKPIYNTGINPSAWCGANLDACTGGTQGGPEMVTTFPNTPYGKSFTLYVYVFITGYFLAVGKITVFIGGSAKPPTPNWLSASIKLATPSGGQLSAAAAAPGTKLVGTVRLSVDSKATGPVTSIRVSPPLAVSPTTVLVAKGGPSPPVPSGGLSINPGSSFSYKVNYVVAAAGTVILNVQATGKGPQNSTQSASGSLTARLGQALAVTVQWLRDGKPLVTTLKNSKPLIDTLQLADGETAEVPADIIAKVVITNNSAVTQEHVSLNGVPPFAFATKSQAVRALPVVVTGGPLPSGQIANLAPGAHAAVTFDVHVTNNGTFTFSPQVLSSSAGSTTTNVSEATSTLTVLPTKLLWLSLHSLANGLVAPGTPVLIAGTITNRSLTEPLELAPLLATISGDGGGGELIDQTAQAQPDGVVLPFAGELGPGQTVDVMGEVGTSFVRGSRTFVDYKAAGTVTGVDGVRRVLKTADVGMTSNSLPIAIRLNVSTPVPASTVQTVAENFVDSTFYYTAKYSYSAFSGAAAVMQHPVDAVAKGVGTVASVLVNTGYSLADVAQLQASVYLLATVGLALTPEQRTAWANQVEADYKASHIKIAADKASEILAAVNKAAYNAFLPFENAIATGDYNQVATLAGQGFGAGLTTAGDLLVSDIIFEKFLIGLGQLPSAMSNTATAVRSAVKSQFAQDITLAAQLKLANITQSLGKGLAGITAGQDLLAQGAKALTDIYGLTKSQIAALQNFCATNKVIIAVRSRSKRAAQLIKDGLAVGKNEILKLKNVNEIDATYLGYSSADLNTIVWAEPVPVEYVMMKLRASGASALERDVVLQRFYLRESEWVNPKIKKVIEQADAAKQIAWNFEGAGNGATTLIKQDRAFALKSQPSPVSTQQWPAMKNRTYQQVRVGNKPLAKGKFVAGTLLVPVTQDVDMMAILTASGEIVSAELRSKFYEYLANLIGIEHGETPSWILNGELIFQAKAKILADSIPGGEALAVFAPTRSVTAGFYNPALTTFNNVAQTGRIFFEGGYNNAFYLWNAKIKIAVGNFAAGL